MRQDFQQWRALSPLAIRATIAPEWSDDREEHPEQVDEMARRNPQRAPFAAFAIVIALLWATLPIAALGAPSIRGLPPTGPWTGTLSIWRADAFSSQATSSSCTAAATQMMLNLVLGGSRTSATEQVTILAWERSHDSLSSGTGSDPQGWAYALRFFGGTRLSSYHWATSTALSTAIKDAAYRMRMTGKPAGLLVYGGIHANVLVGFSATADPALGGTWSVSRVQIAGSYYPRTSPALDPAPGTWLSMSALATRFSRYTERDGLTDWVGNWVTVVP